MFFILVSGFADAQSNGPSVVRSSPNATVTFDCSISSELMQNSTVVHIIWMKNDDVVFLQHPNKREATRFPTNRIRIDPAMPTKLHISETEASDEGMYTCDIMTTEESKLFKSWNLTITGSSFWFKITYSEIHFTSSVIFNIIMCLLF